MARTATPKKPAATKTKADTAAPAEATGTQAQGSDIATIAPDLGRFELLHPDSLVVDPLNVRTEDVDPDPALQASVNKMGVQDPICTRPLDPAEDGSPRYGVFKGQRRMLAAQKAADQARRDGQPVRVVPAFVRDDLAPGSGGDVEAKLLSAIENLQRRAMTSTDTVNTYAQLALMTVEDPAAHERVSAAMALSPGALNAATKARGLKKENLSRALDTGYDLQQLADLAEVEDVPDATRRLDNARQADLREGSDRGHWDQAMATLRQEKADRATLAGTKARLAELGVELLPSHRGYGPAPKDRPLAELTTSLGNKITPETHAKECPGHAARIDPETFEAIFVCKDPHTYKHRGPQAEKITKRTPEENARIQYVTARNRAWRAARTVRQQFIMRKVREKNVPTALETYALEVIVPMGRAYRHFAERGDTGVLATFLGLPESAALYRDKLRTEVAKIGRGRRANLLFAQAAAAMEKHLHDRAWQNPDAETKEYLEVLKRHGYTLSEIEREVIGLKADDDTSAETAAEPEESEPEESDGPAGPGDAAKPAPEPDEENDEE